MRSASSSPSPRAGLLAAWARLVVRRRWLVLAASLVVLVVLVAVAQCYGGDPTDSLAVPGTESQRAVALLQARFAEQAGDSAVLVFAAPAGTADPAVRARIDAVLAEARTLPGVVAVGSPYDPAPPGGAVSADSRIAYATVQYAERAERVGKATVQRLVTLADRAAGDGLTVVAGGQVVRSNEEEVPAAAEALGVLAAVTILLIAFGSVVAMGLPLVTALTGLGASLALLGLSATGIDMPRVSTNFATMLGLGVGIDYALFVVTRFREGLRRGWSVEESVVLAVTTAGRSVLFAGAVVVVALLGMLAVGIPFITALGLAGATVVAMAVLIALTVLPALLALTGRAIDRWRLPIVGSRAEGATPASGLSVLIQRRSLPAFIAALTLLLVLAIPVIDIRLGFADAGNDATALDSHRAYDLLAEGFGPGFNGPLTVVIDLGAADADAAARVEPVRATLATWPGIRDVSPATVNATGDAAVITVIPVAAPQSAATDDLIASLRTTALPSVAATAGLKIYVAGPTAAFRDMGARITDRLPLFFAVVVGVSFLLLTVVFRSPVVALKAAVMNLLSIGAAYGVIVAVFQWGWAGGLFGVKAGPIETFLPMLLFAVLFGLSMDYEVFLISRIREEYARTRDNGQAVARGLAVTARVITAAAAIMVIVFLSFVSGPNRVIKEFGLGLATAVLIDATVVRLVLVPATMELLGDANWWLPRWLDKLLPRLDLEEAAQAGFEPEPLALAGD